MANEASVEALLAAGANVNHHSLSKVRGTNPPVFVTPLLAAVTYPDSKQVVERLIKAGANLMPTPETPDAALRLAALAGDLKTVDLLLSAGMKPEICIQLSWAEILKF